MKIIATLFLCLIAVSARAQDDVYVNLNALNLLTTQRVANAPKFPVMPKRKVVKKQKAPMIAKVEAPKKVEVVKAPETKPEINIVEETYAVDEQSLLQEEFENLPIAKVAVEELPPVTPVPAVVIEPNSEPAIVPVPVASETVQKPAENKPEIASITEVVAQPKPAIDNTVAFDDALAPLSQDNKQKVDDIIATFEDIQNNKIGIIAYNIDDGVEVFKKKRQSLNRAIEVRAYLLDKGYKNFSIRVLNLKDEPQKANMVEIIEI